ncbi:MAG: hypothetical protein PHH54_03445 [Candidatus Nanoarchaeia archaeon]|nr:hypothetical protein [Candidatus Nanoarchaeia archaeon]MDD5741012.1 hypothetical protein [Candidatus Nanoarchaeia archaeon]
MALEKQLEFEFYRDMKKAERYERSFVRHLWDKNDSIYNNIKGWVISGFIFTGIMGYLTHGQEIENYLKNLFN